MIKELTDDNVFDGFKDARKGYAQRILTVHGADLTSALLTSGIDCYNILFDPRWLQVVYLFKETPEVVAVIQKFLNGEYPTNDQAYLEKLDWHQDEVQNTLVDICDAADKLFDNDGKFHPERLDDVVGEVVGF